MKKLLLKNLTKYFGSSIDLMTSVTTKLIFIISCNNQLRGKNKGKKNIVKKYKRFNQEYVRIQI